MWLACTTDAWTSVANVAYMCLTLHFITADWQLVSMSLDCSPFPGSHDGPSVAAKLNELLEAYGISLNNVVAAVTDTAPNMCRAARFMQYDWHGCMAHMLELVTGLCFKGPGVAETMKLARALVGSIKGSSQAAAELARVLAFMNLPVLATIQDVETRWWSTHSMAQRLVCLKRALIYMLSQVP